MRRLAAFLLAPLLIAACAGERITGGLMLTMSTDLVVPTGVDVVGIYIVRVEGGQSTVVSSNEVTAEYMEDGIPRVRLPGTLAITTDGKPDTTIQIRIVAYDAKRVPVAMREARVRVPTEDLKSLPMPLLWLNTEDVLDANPAAGGPTPIAGASDLGFLDEPTTGQASVDAFARFRSDFCGEGRTLDETGTCITIDVDPSALSPWREAASGADTEGTGGGATPGPPRDGRAGPHDFCVQRGGAPPSCFNVAGCFPAADPDPRFRTVEVGTDRIQGLGTPECWISLEDVAGVRGGLAARGAAVAVKTTREQGAFCTASNDCFIPLDGASGATIDPGGRRLVLPPGVCRKATKGSVLSVLASPLCDRKRADEPVCVDAAGVAIDAGCRDGSGWNGDLDDEVPEPDAGRDDGGTQLCASIAGGTGFWVDATHTVVASAFGTFSVFPTSQLAGACLVGAPRTTASSSVLAPAAYRVYGGAGLYSFAGAGVAPQVVAAGLLLLDDGGGFGAIQPVPTPGDWSAGAFVSAYPYPVGPPAPAAAFASIAPSTDLLFGRRDTFEGPAFSQSTIAASTDLVAVDATVVRVVRVGALPSGALQLRTIALPAASTAPAAETTVSPSLAPFLGYVPVALAHVPGRTAALVTTAAETIVLDVDLAEAEAPFAEAYRVPGVAPKEMTLALTEGWAYFGIGGTLYAVKDGEKVAVSETSGSVVHAVQVVGSELYWLESDEAGAATLRHRTLSNGLPVP